MEYKSFKMQYINPYSANINILILQGLITYFKILDKTELKMLFCFNTKAAL